MKRTLLLITTAFILVTANAQLQTLGVRLGYGAELSAQFGGNANRMEADLGLYRNHAMAALAYHRVSTLGEGLDWYYGFGGIGQYANGLGIWAGGIGVIGLEYNFKKVPIQISLDYRPAFFIISASAIDFSSDLTAAGFGIRYRF